MKRRTLFGVEQTSDPDADFDIWWAQYPHKVGKKAARISYKRAWQEVSAQTLLDGVKAYIKSKPPWRDYCNPTTWLNQGRWEDEPAGEGKDKPKSGLDLLTRQQERDLYEFTKQAEPESAYMSIGQSHMQSLMYKHLKAWNTA